MKFTVAFKGLPFEPEKRQVIYVENLYDDCINALVKDNYQQVKWIFKRANLEFIYLPMFFHDEETVEKILYYAPYLTNEIIEKAELRSSYLLGYMSHIDNREKIAPSFIYAPQEEYDEWIFQGQSINLNDIDSNSFIHWLEDFVSETEEELSSAKVRLHVRRYDEDIDKEISYRCTNDWNDAEPKVELSSTPSYGDRFKRGIKKMGEEQLLEEEDSPAKRYKKPTQPSLDDILDEDVRDTIEELERNIERLRLLGIPLDVIKEFVDKYETISRLCITDDLRIFLPEYGNKEVKMPALHKAIYLLFLFHPEGIVLQHLEEHHSEFVNYYRQTSGKDQLSARNIDTINNLEYPGNTSLYSILSKIKLYFRNAIDDHLARHYYIVGSPGEPYKIALSQDLIEWEEEDE